jgi:hypothetical protein
MKINMALVLRKQNFDGHSLKIMPIRKYGKLYSITEYSEPSNFEHNPFKETVQLSS